MKKPLLLLIDDDRAVLEALEAALTPQFEEIARIETFDRPAEVMEAIPRWTEEKRPIAVAIVDQKMPGMTGVELLSRLRDEVPAAHMKSILLTGYAGLDSALAAKNDAGVLRFLEKPWSPNGTCAAVADAMYRSLESSAACGWYSFCEVTEPAEVREHLALRHAVYRMTPGGASLLRADDTLDIDAYDSIARLFNLRRESPSRSESIGTLRIVDGRPSHAWRALDTIAEEQPTLRERLHAERKERFPLLSYVPDRTAVLAFVEKADADGERIGEPGRLTVDPRSRASAGGTATGPLARYLIESAASFFFFSFAIQHCLLSCIPVHARFYRPLGFREVEGTRTQLYPALGLSATCLRGSAADIPSPERARVTTLASRVQRTSATCVCPTFPACQPGPYESGDFRGTDLFCPIAANEALSRVRIQDGGRGEVAAATR